NEYPIMRPIVDLASRVEQRAEGDSIELDRRWFPRAGDLQQRRDDVHGMAERVANVLVVPARGGPVGHERNAMAPFVFTPFLAAHAGVVDLLTGGRAVIGREDEERVLFNIQLAQ